MRYVGFELSPHTTHYALTGIKTKTQIQINTQLAERWAKEMNKRNEYFSTFGIQTVTFTDPDLGDIDLCFSKIARFLSERPAVRPDFDQQLFEVLDFALGS